MKFFRIACLEKTPFQSRKALLKFRYKITQNCPEITSFRHNFSGAIEIRFTYGLVRVLPCDVRPYIIYELEAFNYEEYKKNGFKVKHLGDYPLTLEEKPD